LGEACSAHLAAIRSPATREHGWIGGTITRESVRQRKSIKTPSLCPRRIVIWVKKSSTTRCASAKIRHAGRSRRGHESRINEADVVWLVWEIRLAACETSGKGTESTLSALAAGSGSPVDGAPVDKKMTPRRTVSGDAKATVVFIGDSDGRIEVLDEGGELSVVFSGNAGELSVDFAGSEFDGFDDVALIGELVDELTKADGVCGGGREDGEQGDGKNLHDDGW